MQTDHRMAAVRELLRWKNVSTNLWLGDPLPHIAHLLGLTTKH